MKIKFLEAREVLDGDRVVIQKFKAGQVVEMSNASALHWINRGAAETIGGIVVPLAGPRGPQSVSEKGRFNDKGDGKAAKKTGVEAGPEKATDSADPTSRNSGKGKR